MVDLDKPRRILPLEGVVQNYAWGGHDFIPALLGRTTPSNEPCAELWLGSHTKAPSLAKVGTEQIALTQLLDQAPDDFLGPDVVERFGKQLPFLLKVLDARQMLSIQAHPTLAQAAEGFEREEQASIPVTAPTRNYKDRNHKPEVHVALTDFWMLHGFRPLEEIADILHKVIELRPLMPDFGERLTAAGPDAGKRANLLRELYERAMTMAQAEVDALLNPLIDRLERQPPTDKDQPDFWAARAAKEFPLPNGHRDRGIFSIYLLNLVRLKPGEATYQPAGTLHAYLEGTNVELMANSDNVLRGGLTPKHVDVSELMRILNFASGPAEVMAGQRTSDAETVYPTPAAEFELSRIELTGSTPSCQIDGDGPKVVIVLDGEVTAQAGDKPLTLKRGQAALLPHQQPVNLGLRSKRAVVFKAVVPPAKKC